MFEERARTIEGLSLLLDALCIAFACGAAFLLRVVHDSLPILEILPSTEWNAEYAVRSDYAILLIANWASILVYTKSKRVYRTDLAGKYERMILFYAKALALGIGVTGLLVFSLKISISRLFFGYFFVTTFLFLCAKQILFIAILRRASGSDRHRRHALVLGADVPAIWFSSILRSAHGNGCRLAGLLLTSRRSPADLGDLQILGGINDLDRVLSEHAVDDVFIVGSAKEIAALAPVAERIIERGRTVSIVSTLRSDAHGLRGRITEFSGVPMISYGPMPKDEVRSGMKRAVDVAVSLVALVALSPVYLAIAALVRLVDGGPALFAQTRLGLGGKPFRCYKFRSMRPNAEAILRSNPELYARYVQNDFKLPVDPRVTALGRFLRKTSLDELPQLWNVLKGDMTLVGPRPIVPEEIVKYEPYADFLLSVRPGLTGHWQVSGRSDISYPERAFLDLDYAGRHSMAEDLSIMARTLPAVLKKRGVH